MKNSLIQWTDHTFNPWIGCTKVAPECKNCYAETLMDKRWGKVRWGKGQPRQRTSAANWRQPYLWNREAAESNVRKRVFCASLSDWLDEEVPIEWLADLLKVVHECQNLDWLLLTKRPQNWNDRIHKAFQQDVTGDLDWLSPWLDGDKPENIWIGVSAGAGFSLSLQIPARIHFLSCEPMLRFLDMENVRTAEFDWIIFGGESGSGARALDVDWIRSGLDFCRRNAIAPFVKQLGARPCVVSDYTPSDSREVEKVTTWLNLRDSHGGDMSEWPAELRVREFPVTA